MNTTPGTTPAALIRAARDHADRLALVDGDTRLTFTELHECVRVFAAALVARGLKSGDRVAIWSPNTFHWEIAALGVHWAGGVLVPVNTRYTGTEAADIVERVHATALVVAGDFLGTDRYAALREAAPDLAVPTVVRIPLGGNDNPSDDVIEWDDFL
ncbi:AMP-binding protein, partial [Rhodococcus rhodochrous]